MTNYSRTTLRELKKRYLNILKKCLLANLLAFSFVLPSMAETANEDRLENSGEKTYTQGVTFKDLEHSVSGYSYGGAIHNYINASITFGGLATFEGNSATATGGYSYGGAIHNNASITFDALATFEENTSSATGGFSFGGAISNVNANAVLSFNNEAQFKNNTAKATATEKADGTLVDGNAHGGAISNSGSITFGGLATFEGNSVIATGGHSYGGAIRNEGANAVLTFNGGAQFKNNTAKATAMEKADGSPAGGNAYGGAIGAGLDNAGVLNFKEVDFIANKVHSESAEAYGGAISTLIEPKNHTSHYIKISGSSLFQDNIAQGATKAYGGAIYNESRHNGGVILSDVSFLGNKALSSEGESYGGAISNVKYQKEDGTYIHATTSINGQSLFQDNIAQGATKAYGGAIYNEGGTKNNDGTIKTAGVTLSDVSFIGNKAESTTTDGEAKGGAIYNSGTMQFNGEALFENNIAKHGGAIYNNGTIEFNKKAEFVRNEASGRGSSIFNDKGTITFNDDAIFNNNKGTGWGTIVNQYATINFNDGAEFKNNKLDGGWQHGAGIFNLSAVLNFNNPDKIIVFEGNSVDGCGGSLYNIHGKANFNGFVIFKGKEIIDPITGETDLIRQAVTGGALFNDHGTTVFEKGVLFEKNRAQNGGAIGIAGGTVTFKNGVEFSGNRAPTGNDVYFSDIVGTINFGAVPEDLNQIPETITGAEIVEGGFASKDEKGIVNKYSNSTITFLDSADNTGFKGTFNQYIGKTVAKSESFLGGTNNILGGELETHGNTINYSANIGDETRTAKLVHHSGAVGENQTSLTSALQIGVGSTALFDSATNGIQANYELTEDMAGAGTVTFKDAHLTLGQTNYNGAYVMGENVTLDLQDGDTADSVSFANLTGSANLKIDANIVNGENGLKLVTDQIVTNSDATLKLNLTDVVLSENALDNGLSDSYTATVMTGGTLTYGSEKGLVATDVYSYEVSGANNQITIDAVKFNEGSDVMKSVAEFDGDAAFNMTIGGDSYEMKSDVTMQANEKTIVGKDKETSTLTGKKITIDGAILNVEKVSVSGENQLIDVASGTLNVTNAKVDNIKNAGEATLDTAEVSELENAGTLTANSSEIGELVNEKDATITGGELETATNKEKGMLSLSAGLRAGTVTNEGELTLDGVTVADLTNSARVKANGSTLTKLVNEKEAELANATVKDLTNTGTMTAKDLTLKGALKGSGTATLSGKLVADDIFKSENKIISDGMEVSENIKKIELADLEIKSGTTLDIGTREVTAKEVTVGDKATLQVTLNDLDEHGTMKADKIEAGEGAGVHLVLGEKFEGGVFDVFQGTKGAGDLEVKHNNLYNVIEVEEGKYSFMTKDTEALQESLGATKKEVTVADAMTKGTSTNPAFNKMQSEMLIALQSLETDTVAKAKKALSAVGSKEQPIEQSVASEHLVALQNVVQAELHGSTVGHSGGDTDPRAKVYIKGLYDRTKSTMGEGFRARSKGAVLGVQSEVSEDLTLGVGYATSQTTAKEDLRRTEVDTNTGFVSAHYQPNAWWVSGLATFSRGEYEEEKQILSSMGKASYNVDSWGAQVMTGYDIKLENAIITPEVGLRYLSVKQEGYTDTLGTTVSGTQSDYLTALVGVKGTWDMGAIRPTAGVTVGYDIISDDVSALNTLANGASYTVNGEALERLSTTITTGVEADLGERTTLKLEYSGTFRKEYADHSGMLRLEVKF